MEKVEDFDEQLGGAIDEQMQKEVGWFKRKKKGILTETKDKADAPEGLWSKCPNCKYTCTITELDEHLFVCPKCDYHHRIGSENYFEIIFDDNNYIELFANIISKDHLGFVDLKPYGERLKDTYAKTDIHDSITVAHGKVHGHDL